MNTPSSGSTDSLLLPGDLIGKLQGYRASQYQSGNFWISHRFMNDFMLWSVASTIVVWFDYFLTLEQEVRPFIAGHFLVWILPIISVGYTGFVIISHSHSGLRELLCRSFSLKGTKWHWGKIAFVCVSFDATSFHKNSIKTMTEPIRSDDSWTPQLARYTLSLQKWAK